MSLGGMPDVDEQKDLAEGIEALEGLVTKLGNGGK
jgi:hypothetical protein